MHDACLRIEEESQGALLPSPLPLSCKIAFLSAFNVRLDNRGSQVARSALDPFVNATIFQFAAADSLHRRIIWRPYSCY